MLNDPAINEYTSTWNAVFVRYCDGMAFSANAKEPLVLSSGETLWFRGLDILHSAFAELGKKFKLGAFFGSIFGLFRGGPLGPFSVHFGTFWSILVHVRSTFRAISQN